MCLFLRIGIVFEGDQKDTQTKKRIRSLKFIKEPLRYELLHVLEFDSTRKRMSVLLKSLKSSEYFLFCKGAENSIFSKCSSGNLNSCSNIIDQFALQGWRTLALAFKKLSVEEFKYYDDLLSEAYNDLNQRDEKLCDLYEKLETNLTLLGSTAVEDRLQEDVPKTLEELRAGGIKIWVLTGDKKETAINISESCKHFDKEMERLVLTDLKDKEEIRKHLNRHQRK
jgi:phospholipid-translocating ATPase